MSQLTGPFIAPGSGKVKSLVILLHGYGSNGDDLISIGQEWSAKLPDTAFVAPNAPDVCEAFAGGYQWFSIRAVENITAKSLDRKALIQKPAKILDQFIDAQLKHWGVDESALAVGGFSQGAMMAMYAMPRRSKPCAAVVGYSGMLIDAGGLKGPGIVKVPVLAIHGDSDQVVPPQCLDAVQENFEAAGFHVETVMRPGLGHGIDHFGLVRGLEFVQEGFEKNQQNSVKKARP